MEVLGSNLKKDTGYPHGFHCFPQFFWTNSRTVPGLRRYRFLPNPYQFCIYTPAYDQMLYIADNQEHKKNSMV
jgi:hypothetical protein